MNNELTDFIRAKIADVEKAIKARKHSESTWRGGTDASWKAVGCCMTKKERMETANTEARILLKLNRELAIYNRVLAALTPSS